MAIERYVDRDTNNNDMPFTWQSKLNELCELVEDKGRRGRHWDFVREELIPGVDLALCKKRKLHFDFRQDYTRKFLSFLNISIQNVLRANGSDEDEEMLVKHGAYLGYLTNGAIPEEGSEITAEILSFDAFVDMKKPKRMVIGDGSTGLRPV